MRKFTKLSGVSGVLLSFAVSVSAAPSPQLLQFVQDHGASYGLRLDSQARLLYTKTGEDPETASPRVLSELSAARLTHILALAAKEEHPDTLLARLLRTFLQPSMGEVWDLEGKPLYFRDDQERLWLTDFGKRILMDILTAEDGILFDSARMSSARVVENLAQGMYGLGDYDWQGFAQAVETARTPQAQENLEQWAIDPARETVRILVAAPRSVRLDRYLIRKPEEERAVFQEAGMDGGLLAQFGARAVRAIDNLIALDVPVDQASQLGEILRKKGYQSRPARKITHAAYAAVQALTGAPGRMLGAGLLPVPGEAVRPLNANARSLMRVEALHRAGLLGEGTIVAIVDSGLDLSHPDFQGRVVGFLDFTGEGMKDTIAHGTHVAGSVGGSGEASGGRYKGMAPGTRFLILKVFGDEGETTEDAILAANKAAMALPEGQRPHVLNMSLGGPGDPATDPLARQANEMMLRYNILVVVAAGNAGPQKRTIGSPGNARYVLTVSGTDTQGRLIDFPSRGPVRTSTGEEFMKPDVLAEAGDINRFARVRRSLGGGEISTSGSSAGEDPVSSGCFYAPGGVISARSSQAQEDGCALKGNPYYRFMSGTSMATPQASGIAADIIGAILRAGGSYRSTEVKAAMMETARDLGFKPYEQGAGLLDGQNLLQVVRARLQAGLPVGNVAYMLSLRLSEWHRWYLQEQMGYRLTRLGLYDPRTGHLINTDAELETILKRAEAELENLPFWRRWLLMLRQRMEG